MKFCFAILSILFHIWVTDSYAVSLEMYDFTDPEDVVTAYFECLIEGDIESLTSIIGGDLLKRKKHLLSNVDHYASFLRSYYNDSRLFSIELNRIDDNTIYTIIKVLKQGDITSFSLILLQIDNVWIITDDITR